MKIIEIWKGVKYNKQDLSWRFECSNLGRIRNTKTHRIYKEGISGIGYYQICTSINGKNKNIKTHKAVAETFISNLNNLPFVNHIDGNKLNNNVENLEWVTRQMNAIHAIKMGLLKPSFMHLCDTDKTYIFSGEQNGMAKLSNEDVSFIRKNYIYICIHFVGIDIWQKICSMKPS